MNGLNGICLCILHLVVCEQCSGTINGVAGINYDNLHCPAGINSRPFNENCLSRLSPSTPLNENSLALVCLLIGTPKCQRFFRLLCGLKGRILINSGVGEQKSTEGKIQSLSGRIYFPLTLNTLQQYKRLCLLFTNCINLECCNRFLPISCYLIDLELYTLVYA